MSQLPTHLAAEKALAVAREAVGALWPETALALVPLKASLRPLRATVFRVRGAPQPAVVKVWGPGNADRAQAQTARQAEVAQAMSEGRWRVPGVLHFDAARLALVMTDPGGESLRTLFARHEPVASRAARWLAAYHGQSLRPHPFRPAGHLTWAARLAREVAEGQRTPPEPEAFAMAAAALPALARPARGTPAFRCVTHRDMTLANLVAGTDGSVWGIDFENAREDEPLRDLFTLALDLSAPTPEPDRPALLATLRAGYLPEVATPEARLFLQRALALGVWANTPERASHRQAARLDAARWIMAQDAPVI